MIRSLSGPTLSKSLEAPPVTQDPLAALSEFSSSDAETHIYAITRVNPLYCDQGECTVETVDTSNGQDSPRKSISSGYESRCNSSSDSGSCTECDALPKREKKTKQERRKREKANDLIDNVLAANYSSIKRRQKNFKTSCCQNGTNLSPIPEGRLDVSIPPSIWPQCESCQQPIAHVPAHNGSTDPINFIYKYSEHFPASSNFRIQFLNELADDAPKREYHNSWEECFKIQFEKQRRKVHRIPTSDSGKGNTPDSTLDRRPADTQENAHSVLHDLAQFLTNILQQKNNVPVEDVLMTVSETIHKSLQMLTNPPTVKGEFILYSPHSQKEEVYSSSSSSGWKDLYANSSSSSLESVAERLKIFQRQKAEDTFRRDEKNAANREKDNQSSPTNSISYVHHQRDYSSSSLDSNNSFITPSPPSTSSSANALNGGGFHHEDIYSVPNSVSNIIINDGAKSVDYGSSAYEKLISAKRKLSQEKVTVQEAVADAGGGILPTMKKGTQSLLKKVEHPYYVSMGRPDFTLDLPQAERMMKKIAASKRQRCWCRLTTSFLGLVFFLLSVIVVSMFITRGQKMFGAV